MLSEFHGQGIDLQFEVEVAVSEQPGARLQVRNDARQPVCPVMVGGRPAGYLIGHAVDIDRGELVEKQLDLDEAESPAAVAENALRALNGSFLLLLDYAGEVWAYPDASATVGLVYTPERGKAGSSAHVVLGDEYDALLRRDLIQAFGADNDGWFTAGLTAHDGLFRLLPNHRLNLLTWETERSWPIEMPAYRDDVDPMLRDMGSEMDTVIAALAAARPITQCLTGGNETRALLACNSARSETEFMSLSLPVTGLDLHLAKILARTHGLELRVLPGVKADGGATAVWIKAAGNALSGMNAVWSPSVAPLAGRYLIGGLGGEVGRGFLWTSELQGTDKIGTSVLLGLLKLPKHPLLIAAIERWMEDLPPDLDAFQFLDLAYLELRLGPWGFAQPRLADSPVDISPMISRRQFERMWSLPPAFRRSPGFLRRLVELHDARLLDVPINRYGDWRDRLTPLVRAAQRPDRALRKLRKLLVTR